MAYTEEEAAVRWCPFVRTISGEIAADGSSKHSAEQVAYNRIVDGKNNRWAFPTGGATCIGGRCMAWRWITRRDPQCYETKLPSAHGFCGLAGRDI